MSMRSSTASTTRVATLISLCLASALAGAFLARSPRLARASDDAHKDNAAGVKAPIAEIMHCPLAFAGVHLLKEFPEQSQVAYHFCKPLNSQVNQCVLYD